MKNLVLGLVIIAIVIFSCKEPPCKYIPATWVMSVPTGSGYVEYIVSEGLSRNCLDSTKTMDVIMNFISMRDYRDTIRQVSLLNKVEDFDSGENLSQPKSFFDNVVLVVRIDTISHKPERFTFHDSNGKEIYKGEIWKK